MAFCKQCGAPIPDDDQFCSACGAKKHGEFQQTTNQCPVNIPVRLPTEQDRDTGVFDFLSWWMPLLGLIFYLVWRDTYPLKAKGCGKWAIISVVFDMVVGIWSGILGVLMVIFPAASFLL